MENIAYFYLQIEQPSATAEPTTCKPKEATAAQPKQAKLSADRDLAKSVEDTLPTYPTLYL
ncbi:MAG TPA: hypothetical protein IGS53_28350 [Leptolyngbyaceae cyanobacterium M33_DOE_097]|uniref:Uncharacterized protein n=1 Tax=Oscillatoriales cyanobacterium SpSt-418 TaxID=2282169 RepID=A0A7C3PJL4_9CYAN|nr:hypothetical protein [Leptolyngbyaceae cyanobacterium M33_DOE_097]